MRRSFLISVLVALALTPPAARGEKYVVRRNFTQGSYELIIADTVRQTFKGLKARAAAALNTDSRLEFAVVVEPPDPTGRYEMRMTVRRIVQSVQTRGRTLTCDTAQADEPPSRLRQILLPMVGRSLSAALDRDSRVLSVQGLDAAWDAQATRDPDLAREIQQVRAELGDALVKQALDQITEKLPAVAVSPGLEWAARMHVVLPYVGQRRYRQKVKFDRVTPAGVAVLTLAGHVDDKSQAVVHKGPPVLKTLSVEVDPKVGKAASRLEIDLKGPRPAYKLLLNRTTTLKMTAETPAGKGTNAKSVPVEVLHKTGRMVFFAPWSPPATQPATRPAGP